MEAQNYDQALEKLREKLRKRRGYAARVVKGLYPDVNDSQEIANKKREVYNVAWGIKRDVKILEALVTEAKGAVQHSAIEEKLLEDFLPEKAA